MTDMLQDCFRSVRKNPFAIEDMPQDILTEELCEFSVRQNGYALRFVPLHLRTKRICTIAITNNLMALESVPDDLFSPDEILSFIKSHTREYWGVDNANMIPERFLTPEICRFLIDEVLWISNIPAHFLTEDILLGRKKRYKKCDFEHILKTSPSESFLVELLAQHGEILAFLPEHFKTRDACRNAVANYGPAIEFVPPTFIDQELCLLAAQSQNHEYSSILQFIPEELRTYQICLLCACSDGYELFHVPKPLLDEQICLTAVKNCGHAIKFIPEELKTKEICMVTLSERDSAWDADYVPEAFLEDREIALAFVRKNAVLLDRVPPKHLDHELYLEASLSPMATIGCFPDEVLTWQMCANMIRQNPWCFDSIPERFRDEAMAKEVKYFPRWCSDDWGGLFYVPEELRTYEVYLAHVEYCAIVIRDVPEEMCTREMWLTAAKSYVEKTEYRNFINWIELTSDLEDPLADYKGRLFVSRQEFAEMSEAMRELCVVRD